MHGTANIPIRYQHISEERPLVLRSFNDVAELVKDVLTVAGVLKEESDSLPKYEEYNRKTAEKVLQKKGYRVSSYQAFMELMGQHKITGQKRGRELWFSADKIDSIPPRK